MRLAEVAPRGRPVPVPGDLGLKFFRVRAIPVPPKKTLAEHVADQAAFLETKLKPVLAAAQAGEGHVFFVDAAHFVFGTFLCYLASFTLTSCVRLRDVSGSMSWGRGMR